MLYSGTVLWVCLRAGILIECEYILFWDHCSLVNYSKIPIVQKMYPWTKSPFVHLLQKPTASVAWRSKNMHSSWGFLPHNIYLMCGHQVIFVRGPPVSWYQQLGDIHCHGNHNKQMVNMITVLFSLGDKIIWLGFGKIMIWGKISMLVT